MAGIAAAHLPDGDAVSAPTKALITVVVLCFGGLSAALTQTLVIPIQSELPQLLHTSAANAVLGDHRHPARRPRSRCRSPGGWPTCSASSGCWWSAPALLLVGSVICALSDSLTPMLVGRALQGLAMGFIPVGISLMREVTPPQHDRHRDRVDERHPRRRRCHRPAAVGLGRPGLRLARPVLDVGGAGGCSSSPRRGSWCRTCTDAAPAAASTSSAPSAWRSAWSRSWSAISKGNDWGWGDARTLGTIGGRAGRARRLGRYELRSRRPARRPAGHRPAPGPADEPRRGGDRVRDDGPGDRRTAAAADPVGHRLRPRARPILEAGLWMAPGGLMMLLFAPGLGPADDAHRRQAHADDRRGRARQRLPRRPSS